MRRVDGRERGAPVHGGEPARVAVGEHVHAAPPLRDPAQQRQPVLADAAAGLCIVVRDGVGLVLRRVRALAHGQVAQPRQLAVERPAQIDGGRPGFAHRLAHRLQPARILAHGESHAVRRDGADQRRAAHAHGANRLRRLLPCGEPQLHHLPGQAGLVEDADGAVRVAPDAAPQLAVDAHA